MARRTSSSMRAKRCRASVSDDPSSRMAPSTAAAAAAPETATKPLPPAAVWRNRRSSAVTPGVGARPPAPGTAGVTGVTGGGFSCSRRSARA